MNTQDAKRVLETALICANQPLPLRAMRNLFDDQIGSDTLRSMLDELVREWSGKGVELVSIASGLAYMGAQPDLDRWSERRTTAVAWEDSAPGPQVHTLAGVVTCVRDAASVEAAYADQVTAFNARFNALADGHATARVVAALLG